MSFDGTKYKNDFVKENYARITVLIPKNKKDELVDYAKCNDLSMNALIIKALQEYTQIDLRLKSQK